MYKDLEERVDNLEALLERFILHTDQMVRRMDKDARRREAEFQQWQEKLEAERKQREEERKEDRREWNKKWGEMANKLGTIPEDIVAPNIPRLAKELFGCGEIQDFMARRWRQKPSDASQRREFDVIAVCENKVILNETKATVRQDYMENFIKLLPEIYEYFPEWRGKEIIPVFASLYLTPEQIKYLSRNRIYAMGMGDDTMQILNFAEVSGKTALTAP